MSSCRLIPSFINQLANKRRAFFVSSLFRSAGAASNFFVVMSRPVKAFTKVVRLIVGLLGSRRWSSRFIWSSVNNAGCSATYDISQYHLHLLVHFLVSKSSPSTSRGWLLTTADDGVGRRPFDSQLIGQLKIIITSFKGGDNSAFVLLRNFCSSSGIHYSVEVTLLLSMWLLYAAVGQNWMDRDWLSFKTNILQRCLQLNWHYSLELAIFNPFLTLFSWTCNL